MLLVEVPHYAVLQTCYKLKLDIQIYASAKTVQFYVNFLCDNNYAVYSKPSPLLYTINNTLQCT